MNNRSKDHMGEKYSGAGQSGTEHNRAGQSIKEQRGGYLDPDTRPPWGNIFLLRTHDDG